MLLDYSPGFLICCCAMEQELIVLFLEIARTWPIDNPTSFPSTSQLLCAVCILRIPVVDARRCLLRSKMQLWQMQLGVYRKNFFLWGCLLLFQIAFWAISCYRHNRVFLFYCLKQHCNPHNSGEKTNEQCHENFLLEHDAFQKIQQVKWIGNQLK